MDFTDRLLTDAQNCMCSVDLLNNKPLVLNNFISILFIKIVNVVLFIGIARLDRQFFGR